MNKRHPGRFYLWFSQVYSMLRSQRMLIDNEQWERLDALELPVPCGGCTRCCRGPYVIPLLDHEAPRFKHKEKGDDGRWVIPRVRPENGQEHCVYLGQDGCEVHDSRPNVCKMFDCRTHMVCGIGDPNNREMVDQWAAEAWHDTDAVIIIGALRTAAKYAMDKVSGRVSSAGPIVEYAFSHFPIWLGPVVEKLGRDTPKSFEEMQDGL